MQNGFTVLVSLAFHAGIPTFQVWRYMISYPHMASPPFCFLSRDLTADFRNSNFTIELHFTLEISIHLVANRTI